MNMGLMEGCRLVQFRFKLTRTGRGTYSGRLVLPFFLRSSLRIAAPYTGSLYGHVWKVISKNYSSIHFFHLLLRY